MALPLFPDETEKFSSLVRFSISLLFLSHSRLGVIFAIFLRFDTQSFYIVRRNTSKCFWNEMHHDFFVLPSSRDIF